MTFQDIFKSSFLENITSISIFDMTLALLLAFGLGVFIFFVYKKTFSGVMYSSSFGVTLIAMTMITTVVILAVTSNVVLSLGMVGALSIVRFRTAVKDSRDTMFIFWAMAEGLCVSSQNWRLTFTTVLFIAAILIISSKAPGLRNKYLLVVRGGGQAIDRKQFEEKLKPYVVSFRVRTVNKDAEYEEMICEIGTKGEINLDVLDALLTVSGIQSVNWVAQSGETVG